MRIWTEWVAQNTLKMDCNCILYIIVLTTNFDCSQNFGGRKVGKGTEIVLTDYFSGLFFANSHGLSKYILLNLG